MKRTILFLLAAAMLLLCGCAEPAGEQDTFTVVAAIFPVYDWAAAITQGTDTQVTLLIDGGTDMHSYEATVPDILTVLSSDAVLYIGGTSDDWLREILANGQGNPDQISLCLMDALGADVLEEQRSEGMQTDEEEDDEADEHIWLSLKNAEILVQAICDALSQADPENAAAYAANTQAYIEELSALDDEYTQMAADAVCDTVVFGDRFPFLYLMDDYGINWYAAFPGCSAETEASFETVIFLADKLDELGLGCILTIDGSDGSVARAIVQNSDDPDRAVLEMNSMQSVTDEQLQNGANYLDLMSQNLAVLSQALHGEEG